MKLKQLLIAGLDFAERYKIVVEWDAYVRLFLRYEGKGISVVIRKDNPYK